MKYYQANNELFSILKQNGLIDTTSERNKIKGKKSFKISKNARKEIHFDYINIHIYNSAHEQDYKTELTEQDLKNLIFYTKLPLADFKEFSLFGKFNFKKFEERIDSLKKDLELLIEFNLRKKRQNKIKALFKIYDDIVIN